ncbi:DUF1636 family protein [Ruegeria marina]|uniref:Predicted metal-binding protein n=1 Tax=Ruegeria marina TaxID=639004 RepID=A0A1G6L3B4_9RHOB|nr:DUF1636 family protein [Ruegeria marina]SDC37809.1 Predicted metal-binding protein [Ruegeria marina]
MTEIRLSLCSSCLGERDQGEELRAVSDALCRVGLTHLVDLSEHACFGACEAPVAMALQGAGRASYVFSGLDPVTDATDIAATCRAYLDSPLGWIEDARVCGRLRLCLRARLPAVTG